MAEGEAVWTEKILKTIKERPWKDGKGFGLWVVQKIKDGKSHSVTVRAGMYKTSPINPDEKILPKEGLEEADFTTLRAIYKDEVLPLLQIAKGTAIDPRDGAPPEPEQMPW